MTEIQSLIDAGANAFKCFMGTDLDHLVIEHFMLNKIDQINASKEDYKDKYELD